MFACWHQELHWFVFSSVMYACNYATACLEGIHTILIICLHITGSNNTYYGHPVTPPNTVFLTESNFVIRPGLYKRSQERVYFLGPPTSLPTAMYTTSANIEALNVAEFYVQTHNHVKDAERDPWKEPLPIHTRPLLP